MNKYPAFIPSAGLIDYKVITEHGRLNVRNPSSRMNNREIVLGFIAWLFAGLGIIKVYVYGVLVGVPERIPHDVIAVHVLPLPIIAVLLPILVMRSAHRHGVFDQAVAYTCIPLTVSMLTLLEAVEECLNSWG